MDDHYAEKRERALSIKHRDQSEETFLDNDPTLTSEASGGGSGGSSAAECGPSEMEERKTNKQSHLHMSSSPLGGGVVSPPKQNGGAAPLLVGGDEEGDSLLRFEEHFNECNNVERTAAMEGGTLTTEMPNQNGGSNQTIEKQDVTEASDIDKVSRDVI